MFVTCGVVCLQQSVATISHRSRGSACDRARLATRNLRHQTIRSSIGRILMLLTVEPNPPAPTPRSKPPRARGAPCAPQQRDAEQGADLVLRTRNMRTYHPRGPAGRARPAPRHSSSKGAENLATRSTSSARRSCCAGFPKMVSPMMSEERSSFSIGLALRTTTVSMSESSKQ